MLGSGRGARSGESEGGERENGGGGCGGEGEERENGVAGVASVAEETVSRFWWRWVEVRCESGYRGDGLAG